MNDIFKYNRSESEDYYKLLGCSIHSTVSLLKWFKNFEKIKKFNLIESFKN